MNRTRKLAPRGMFAAAALLLAAAAPIRAAAENLTEDDLRWREMMGWNPQVHGTRPLEELEGVFAGGPVARAPYAFYPYSNEIEVLFDYHAAIRPLPDTFFEHPNERLRSHENGVKTLPERLPEEMPDAIILRVVSVEGDMTIFEHGIPLDGEGRGYGLFPLPKLERGTYRVEYDLGGGAVIRSNRLFTRSYFDFEHNAIGKTRDVFPPFLPVTVEGRTVTVVDRTYTINAQGLFDSVFSQGRELLAEPMELVVELESGERVVWQDLHVAGQATHPDTAVFETTAKGSGFSVQSSVTVEEDGCAKVQMTLNQEPGTKNQEPIKRAYLRMALKESEAPLCHLTGMNSMRHNYAGNVPRGGAITWINQSWRPARFEVTPFEGGETPDVYEVWDATKNMHWGSQRWNFAPYVWLGAEERGLAWFGDHVGGYAVEDRTGRGIQRLRIEPGKVVLHVELIQRPVAHVGARTFTFGLQASPTKPMMEDWRGYHVPGGGGMAVNVWGGYNCASKYPDPKDWRIPEMIVSARDPEVNRNVWQGEFREFFEKMNAQRQFPTLTVHGGEDWLRNVLGFASRVRRSANGITVYFEEFQTSGLHPESYEFMDEWDMSSWLRFTRFNYQAGLTGEPWGDSRDWGPEARTANQPSYRDFAVHYADQWMRRGVGIYYDNAYPKTDNNRFTLREHGVNWQSSIWGKRDYFRRVWKRSRELMASGELPIDPYDPDVPRPMRLHVVGHVTNAQILPHTTWWDATLGVEAPGQWIPDPMPGEAARRKSLDEWGFVIVPGPREGQQGHALPYPPDYLRAMEMGRMVGVVPHYRHLLRSEDAFGGLGIGYGGADRPAEDIRYHRLLSDKAMGLVHEIRGGGNPYDHDTIRTLTAAFDNYGYGKSATTVHNYWVDEPFLKLDNPDVKWIALERTSEIGGRRSEVGSGNQASSTRYQAPVLALLQSYDAEACEVRIDLPPDTALLDLFSRRLVDAGAPLTMPADYGTRLLLVGPSEALAPLAWDDDILLRADFGFGLPPGWRARGGGAPRIVADSARPGNRVLRIVPGHPSQNYLQGETAGDYALSLRFRLPELTEKPPHAQFYGVLQLLHRQVGGWPKQNGQALALGIQKNAQGDPALAMSYITRREGDEEAFANITIDRRKETGALVPLDDAWHTLTIRVEGNRHTVGIDGVELFSGETDVTDGGALFIGPGWGAWSPGYVEIDELVARESDE